MTAGDSTRVVACLGVTMIELPSPALIGVLHLSPLPGSASHSLPMHDITTLAMHDARTLSDARFDAMIIENYGDAPFTKATLPPASLASMAVIADRVRREVQIPIGINALRNDALAALGIASAVGASFIRVNVHTGVSATDQGWLEGRAEQTLRYRKQLGQRIAILADVHVKHATPISEPDIVRAAKDTAYRGLADGLILTGSATGEAVDLDDVRRVRDAVPDRPLFAGSGARVETVESLLTVADGVIVGTGIKPDGDITRPIDSSLAQAFALAAGRG